MQENDIITDGATRFKVRKMSPYERIEQLESTVNTFNDAIEKMRSWINNFSAAPSYGSIINIPQNWVVTTNGGVATKSVYYTPPSDGVVLLVFSSGNEGNYAAIIPSGGFPVYGPRAFATGNWQSIICPAKKGAQIEFKIQEGIKCEQLNFAPLSYEQQQEV